MDSILKDLAEHDTKLIDSILRQHARCTPIKLIARQECLRPCTVRFVIQNHRLPDRQLPVQWLMDAQPTRSQESTR